MRRISRFHIGINFKWQDLWVGAYIVRKHNRFEWNAGWDVFICIVPMFPIHISWEHN